MSKDHKINYQIKSNRVDLVLPEGEGIQRGVELKEAVEMAREMDLDLVEMAPEQHGKLAVCKILDYGKLKYRESKKKKSQKRVTKEIRFSYRISDHDLEIKEKKVENFLDKRYIVHYTVELRGREKGLVEQGRMKIEESLEKFESKATWSPLQVSKGGKAIRISTTLSPS